jgi:GNAT superfamily N-acetyltransferase
MGVSVRAARYGDLEAADDLVVGSINDLTERQGYGRFAAPGPPKLQAFSLRDDPEGLWIAEDAGRMLGFAFSWTCGDLWFLAQLFVSPDHQGGGIGAELLKRTLAHAEARQCEHRALITFAFNRVSQALYMRHGFFPRVPVYMFSVPAQEVRGETAGGDLRPVPLDDTPSSLRELANVDARALGLSREKHHRYLLADADTEGFGLYAGAECVGYAYLSRTGHIGPLAVVDDGLLGTAFDTALRLAAAGNATQVSAFLPGTATSALAAAVQHRMRITLPMVLMATEDFGQWTRYLPRNPGFM